MSDTTAPTPTITIQGLSLTVIISAIIGVAGGVGSQHLSLPELDHRIARLESKIELYEHRISELEEDLKLLAPIRRRYEKERRKQLDQSARR